MEECLQVPKRVLDDMNKTVGAKFIEQEVATTLFLAHFFFKNTSPMLKMCVFFYPECP